MLIDGKRALAYITVVDEIKPIPDYDRVEYARVGGWWCVVQKNVFNVGDHVLYFEVDSKVPSDDQRFAFLAKKDYKIKTQKMCKVYSQGLIMPLSDFPELKGMGVHTDVTDIIGVVYAVYEDNKRKKDQSTNNKYENMSKRYPKLARNKCFKWLMKRGWGNKLLFAIFGSEKQDVSKQFPVWVKKTDEERCENMPWILENKNPFVVTEKIDGTSLTCFLDITDKRHPEFGVCSRNVRQQEPDVYKEYYKEMSKADFPFYPEPLELSDSEKLAINNVYWEMAIKYRVQRVLERLAREKGCTRVVVQGEIYGDGVQGNPYRLDERRLAAFNVVTDGCRWGSVDAQGAITTYGIPFVPILDKWYILPDDFEEFKASADGRSMILGADGKECKREGLVYRSPDGQISFKSVSRAFSLRQKQ